MLAQSSQMECRWSGPAGKGAAETVTLSGNGQLRGRESDTNEWFVVSLSFGGVTLGLSAIAKVTFDSN